MPFNRELDDKILLVFHKLAKYIVCWLHIGTTACTIASVMLPG
jgi:hypothetical protein